jgi:hypothetical protein
MRQTLISTSLLKTAWPEVSARFRGLDFWQKYFVGDPASCQSEALTNALPTQTIRVSCAFAWREGLLLRLSGLHLNRRITALFCKPHAAEK